ncbi:uncharacterized protein LOC115695694 isoform X1 [Cannabis sativa]|uniref:uncharacterized protein LOC115695694 isoform X1 n=1 Tax=Cannabis sativa TaxID=3483 RepID=UPI0029C9F664|nr:uncharacterized protein LOC115695694 isoform X1 [Cannabis sativa]XP_030478622.2 uncharacterized protein LOC115695694 isoform X1 [Cannabis sativa]XP_060972723.1 uncharacterized protein LOC115695694 isoform X1 [Cannabis sativa]
MLSVEKHPPTDPSSSSDHNHNLNHNHHEIDDTLPQLDLSNPTTTLLPKFSIRDYVFTSRNKDIKTNWPFSQKNLQLCLKHGVKDVLPPFQTIDSVKNQTLKRSCTVEEEEEEEEENIASNTNIITNSNTNTTNINSNIFDGEPSESPVDDDNDENNHDDHDHPEVLLDSFNNTQAQQLNQKQKQKQLITSCGSGENDTTTSSTVCQSEFIDHNQDHSTEPAPPPPLPPLPPFVHKNQTTNRNSGSKKCRLIVKFGSNLDRSSAEDIASNCSNPSESMASKVCPVCKVFSSSSNTTLNAHIDQCLSVESTSPKWTVDSSTKLSRHRIKPRKTKLMVDIYATAIPCTLEDLDRRNGSNWATVVSSFPIQQSNDKSDHHEMMIMPLEDDSKRVSSSSGPSSSSDHHHHNSDDVDDDVGAVYIDSNGIKLRILSKSDDIPSVSKLIEHLRPRKPLKGATNNNNNNIKGTKFLSTRKKKRRQYKYNKYLNKLAQTKRKLLSSSKSPRSPLLLEQKNGGQGKQYGAERSNMEKQVNPSNPGTLGRWVCSKRTGVAKKVNSEARHQQVQRKWPGNEDSGVESLQSRLDRNGEEEDVMDLSPENSDSRLEKVFYEARACHKREQPPPSSGLKRSAKSSLSSATSRGNVVERSFATMKPRQLRKDISSANDYRMLKPPKCTSPVEDFEPPPGHASKFRSKARKISSAREHLLSSQRSSPVAEADDSDVANNFSALKKSQVHLMTETETDDEAALWNSDASNEFHRKFAGNESESDDDMNNETSLCRSTGFEVRQNTGVLGIAGRNAAKVSENLFSSTLDKADDDMGPTCEDEDEEEEDLQCSQDDPIRDSALANWRKSADPEVDHKPGNRSKILSNSLQYKGALFDVEGLTGPGGTSFVSEQETFYSDRLGDDGMLVQDVNIGEEQESDEDGEASRFPEVDPILIPGPPGSFLPSPRDMGSEDFQGNSSLTTSRVQSSQDQHDFIDGDSSDSPVSATSTISNFTATRDDHHRKHAELLPSVVHQQQAIQDKIRSSLSGGSVDSSIENVPLVPRTTTNTAAERVTYDREKFKANNKIPLNDEPCCCQRKERAAQGVVLDYQESQLLRRRAMTSVIMENQQTSCNLNNRPNNNNMESRSDMYTPSSTCPTSKSEQEVVHRPAVNSSGNQNAMRGSAADAAVAKFTSRGDCDSMSPSSNSILRLMGKNLMVVNRDQDESIPQAQAQSQSQLNHITSPFSTFTGVSPSSTTQNHVYRPFQHPNFQRGSIFPGQQCVDPRISNGMRTYEGAACSFSNHRMDSGFGINMELREFEADYSIETPHRKFKTVLSGVSPVKEIITIDDAPETEADLTGDHTAKYSRGFGENPIVSSSGIMIPNYNAKRSNTSFYSCQSDHDQSMHPEPPLVHHHHHHHHSSGFHSLSSRQPNSSPARWSTCPTDDGSAGNHPYITASSSSSRGHMRSPAAMYNNNRQSLR